MKTFAMNSLGKKFLAPVLALVIALLAGLGLFMAANNSASIRTLMDSKGNAVADFMLKIGAVSYTNFDFLSLEEYVKEITRDPEVAFAVYYDAEGKALTKHSDEPSDASSFIIYQRAVTANNGSVLGSLKLGYHRKNLSNNLHRSLFIVSAGILIAILLLAAGITYLTNRMISRPLSAFAQGVARITEGDLTTTLACNTNDEIGLLGKNINSMAEFFDNMIHGITAFAAEVVGATAVLRSRAGKTTVGAREQSSRANQIAASAEEMSQTITDISKNAAEVAAASAEAKDTAEAGQEVAGMADTKANDVYNATVELTARVEKLTKRVAEIGEIVVVIKSIADQTNLLALNAAIEAARAGEQGRGFSVVADEVRKLAERTIKATVDISDKIGAVQEESSQTAQFMTEASSHITGAKQFIVNLNGTLRAIVGTVQQVNDQIARIATAVEQQSSTSEDVAKNIEKTSIIAGETGKMADDIMLEIDKLATVAEHLRNETAGFKTRDGKLIILDLAKTDHRTFMDKIGSCLNGVEKLDPAQLPDHRSCRFGKWYFSKGREAYGMLPSFQAIDDPHAKIHALAKETVSSSNAGDKQKAEGIYQEMEKISSRISGLIDQIKADSQADKLSLPYH